MTLKLKMESNIPVGKDWMFEPGWDFSNDSARDDVVKFINEPEDKKIKVLDVGCASGRTLRHIRSKFPYSKLFGLEPDTKLAKKARETCEVYNESIEDFISDPDYEFEGYFDYILFSDVFEHLLDPWTVCRDIKKFLKDGGHLLCSIPNIAFVENLYNLLNGRFCYGSKGIVNKAHLRFFTLYEIIDMFETCGYANVEYAMNTNVELNESLLELIEKLKVLSVDGLTQHYNAYQYIVKGIK